MSLDINDIRAVSVILVYPPYRAARDDQICPIMFADNDKSAAIANIYRWRTETTGTKHETRRETYFQAITNNTGGNKYQYAHVKVIFARERNDISAINFADEESS